VKYLKHNDIRYFERNAPAVMKEYIQHVLSSDEKFDHPIYEEV